MTDAPALTSLHQKSYGLNMAKRGPDPARCCVEVSNGGRWPSYHQCNRPRGHGPEGAYCKQHDPEVVAARRAASEAAYNEKRRRKALMHADQYLAALRKIAEGHNDPRALAAEVVADFDRRYPPASL